MKKFFDPEKLYGCDEKLRPSEELNERTLAKMASAKARPEEKAVGRRYSGMRRWVTAAACLCAAVMLTSAGVRVFEYLMYVPGRGIVTSEVEETYVLPTATEIGRYYIEGVSVILEEDGYEMTVITNRPAVMGEDTSSLTVTDSAGNEFVLPFSGGGNGDSTYCGTVNLSEDLTYTMTLAGKTTDVRLTAAENSVYAKYAYPVSDGITVIAFPLADNTNQVVYDILFEPQSEEMRYWADAAEEIRAHLNNVVITDTEGNEYRPHTYHGNSTDGEIDVTTAGEYKNKMRMAYRMICEERFAAPIADIEIGSVELSFHEMNEVCATLTVPEEEGYEEVNTVLVDKAGIRHTADRTFITYDSDGHEKFTMTSRHLTPDFTENVIFGILGYRFEFEDGYFRNSGRGYTSDYVNIYAGNADVRELYQGDQIAEDGSVTEGDFDYFFKGTDYRYQIEHHGETQVRKNRVRDGEEAPEPVKAGDPVTVVAGELILTFAGDWDIRFVEPAE